MTMLDSLATSISRARTNTLGAHRRRHARSHSDGGGGAGGKQAWYSCRFWFEVEGNVLSFYDADATGDAVEAEAEAAEVAAPVDAGVAMMMGGGGGSDDRDAAGDGAVVGR